MLYVKNNVKFAVMFKTVKAGKEVKFEFDCRRVFKDTGNMATTGVTPIADDDFDLLYKENKMFKKYVDKGFLEKTKESGATTAANKMDALEKENELLKQQLAEKTKEAATATNDELEAAKAENETLKKQLEALGKKNNRNKPTAKPSEDSEGF